jgi:hypothetical protein
LYFNYTEYESKPTQQHFSGRDFYIFYLAGELGSEGHPSTAYNESEFYKKQRSFTSSNEVSEYGYPPIFTLLLEPFSYIPYKDAFIVWIFLQLTFFTLVIHKYLIHKPLEQIIFIGLPIVMLSLNWGQTGVLIASLYITAFSLLKKKPALSGLCLSIATIKPHLGILIFFYLLGAKHYKPVIYGILWTLILILLTTYHYGADLWIDYFNYISTHTSAYISKYDGLTLGALFRTIGIQPQSAHLLQLTALFCGIIYSFRLGIFYKKPSFKTQALLAGATSLVIPYFNIYDYAYFTATALAACLNNRRQLNTSSLFIVLLIYFYTEILLLVYHKIAITPFITLALMLYIKTKISDETKVKS